jgi:hypothetical protein
VHGLDLQGAERMITASILVIVALFLILIINDNKSCRTYEHDSYDLIQEMKRHEERERDRKE